MSDFTLGQHDAAIKLLLDRTEQMERDIGDIKAILSERRGERRVGYYVASALGAISGWLATVFA